MQLKSPVIGIDIGGSFIKGARVNDHVASDIISKKVTADGSEEKVLYELFCLIDLLVDDSVSAIGIGVPSVVDMASGIVYDVQNIPSWKEVQLKKYLEDRYHLPVYINNDANCFALGEKYFGKARHAHSFVGLTLGTGLGAGIIINDKLYTGANCGAGEFGMINYLDSYYENYASGHFFLKHCQREGTLLFQQAISGDADALKCFYKFGEHIGNVIKAVLYCYDPEMVVLGGSIKNVYNYFRASMWEEIRTFTYQRSLEKLRIEISELDNSGILGAAALCYDADIEYLV